MDFVLSVYVEGGFWVLAYSSLCRHVAYAILCSTFHLSKEILGAKSGAQQPRADRATRHLGLTEEKGLLKQIARWEGHREKCEAGKTAQKLIWTNIWEHFSISNHISQVFPPAASWRGPWGGPGSYWQRGGFELGAAGRCLLRRLRNGEGLSVQTERRSITPEGFFSSDWGSAAYYFFFWTVQGHSASEVSFSRERRDAKTFH